MAGREARRAVGGGPVGREGGWGGNGGIERREVPRASRSEPGRLGGSLAFRTEGLVDEFDEPRAVDQFDRVLGGELLGGDREGAGGDEEALVAEGVMDRPQEFLEFGGADHA